MILETETAYFEAHLDEWMKTCPGKIALVKGERLIGMFGTYEDALAEAARRFGLASFLMRRVRRSNALETLDLAWSSRLGKERAASRQPLTRSDKPSSHWLVLR